MSKENLNLNKPKRTIDQLFLRYRVMQLKLFSILRNQISDHSLKKLMYLNDFHLSNLLRNKIYKNYFMYGNKED